MSEIKRYDLTDLHGAFDAGEIRAGIKVEVKGYVATIGEIAPSKKTGNDYRIIGIKGSPDADGTFTVVLSDWVTTKGALIRNVNLIHEDDIGQELVFQGFINVSDRGYISLGGASIPSRRPQRSQGDSQGSSWRPRNPLPPIVGMLFNRGMAAFEPMAFLNGDYKANTQAIGARIDCVINAITLERVHKLAALAKEE